MGVEGTLDVWGEHADIVGVGGHCMYWEALCGGDMGTLYGCGGDTVGLGGTWGDCMDGGDIAWTHCVWGVGTLVWGGTWGHCVGVGGGGGVTVGPGGATVWTWGGKRLHGSGGWGNMGTLVGWGGTHYSPMVMLYGDSVVP